MTRPNGLVPPESLVTVLVKLGRAVELQLHQTVSASGINANQFVALMDIARTPGVSRADLARALGLTPQAVTGIVTCLLGQGLVTRQNTGPGRPTELRISPRGLEVLRAHGADLRHLHGGLARGGPPGAACSFDAEARRLLDHLHQTTRRRPVRRRLSG